MTARHIGLHVLLTATLLATVTSASLATTTGINISAPRDNLTVATSVGGLTLAIGIIQNQCGLSLHINVPGGLTAVTPGLDRIGRVVAATLSNCDLPSAFLGMPRTLGSTPTPTWGDVEFLSTDLPHRARQHIIIHDIQFELSGCLIRGDMGAEVEGTIASNNGIANSMTLNGNPIPGITGGLCPTTMRWLGALTLSPTVNYTLLP
jgi:hypothetical protein